MKKVAFADISNWGMPPAHFNMRSARFMGADRDRAHRASGAASPSTSPGAASSGRGEDSPNEKVYLVLEGELTLTGKDGRKIVLGPKDSIYIGPGEGRSLLNTGSDGATMLVVVNVIPQ